MGTYLTAFGWAGGMIAVAAAGRLGWIDQGSAASLLAVLPAAAWGALTCLMGRTAPPDSRA